MRRESLAPLAAAVAVLAALAALLFWLLSPGDEVGPAPLPPASSAPDDASVPGTPDTDGAGDSNDEAVYDGPTRTVTVWVDGWSQLTVGLGTEPGKDGAQLLVAATRPGGRQGPVSTVSLTPVSSDELLRVGRTEPGLLTRLAARMVRFDALLDCDASGCVSQRGPVPLEWLAAPREVPSLGEVYDAWGVEHGVFAVSVEVPSDAVSVSVSSPGWEPVSVPVAGRDHVVVAAAFGTWFPLTPNWVTGQGIWLNQPYEVSLASGVAPASGLPAGFADGTAFWRGLAVPVPQAGGLHPSVLTMLSSPTFGCNGALCVPGVADVSFETVMSSLSRACVPESFPEASGLAAGAEALAAVSQLTVTVVLPHPVRQVGADLPPFGEWDGHVAGGVGPFTGDPALVSGVTVLRVQQAWLFVGDDLAPHVGYFRRPGLQDPVLSGGSWDALSPVVSRCR